MWERTLAILNEEVVIPLWVVVGLVALNLLLLAGAVLLGFWRGSTLPVRTIRAIALAFLGYPVLVFVVENFLNVKMEGISWDSALVACFAIGCLTYIETKRPIEERRAEDEGEVEATDEEDLEDEETLGHRGMKDLYEEIVYEWVEAVADDGTQQVDLRRSVLYVIVRKDYPGNKVHESPSITWPTGWTFTKKWNLVSSVWKALATHGARQLPAIENDFQTVADALRSIVEDGPEQ